MKIKILVFNLIFIFLIVITNINIHAATWEFRWTNTVIHMPLGGNLSEYSLIPEAKLYRDGVLLTDANISYMREGDWLYFMSNVNSTKIGTYKVWYKASENEKYKPGTCNGYKALISFVVEDSIPPKIDLINDNLFIQRVKDITDENRGILLDKLDKNVVVSDNYSDCDIKFNHNINFTLNGTYPVDVTAIDLSGNRTTKTFNVTIYDSSYPVIDFKGEEVLKLPLNGDINIRDYFQAYDEIDGDISANINYPELDLSIASDFLYTVTVKNKSGNETSYTIKIYVIDDTPPIIEAYSKTLIVDYKTNFDEYNFTNKVKIIDNQPVNYDNLSIETDIKNEVGNYKVYYYYTDGINYASEEINIKCVSKEKPKIIADDIIIKTKSNVSLKDFIRVEDESDALVSESLEIDDAEVNYKKAGTYYASVYAINSSGLSQTERIKVIIQNGGLSGINIPILIIMIALSFVTIGYGIFFVYYFYFRKKKKKTN